MEKKQLSKANRLVIIGGGVIGIAIAREVSLHDLFSTIIVLEKENNFGMHASTRNSGVIHAGFYYDPNSNRGKFCAEANQLLREYCVNNSIPLNKCGKVVVAQNEEEELVLNELYQRGLSNGSSLELLNSDALYDIEPLAKTYKKFLWSPNTWSASPKHFLSNLIRECKERGVQFMLNYEVERISESSLVSKNGDILQYDFHSCLYLIRIFFNFNFNSFK